MLHHFRLYQPEQPVLLRPDLQDWLHEHLCVQGERTAEDALDLAALTRLEQMTRQLTEKVAYEGVRSGHSDSH